MNTIILIMDTSIILTINNPSHPAYWIRAGHKTTIPSGTLTFILNRPPHFHSTFSLSQGVHFHSTWKYIKKSVNPSFDLWMCLGENCQPGDESFNKGDTHGGAIEKVNCDVLNCERKTHLALISD